MSGRGSLRARALMAIVLLATGTATRAQTALAPFGVTDRAARNLLLAEMRSNGSTAENRDIVAVVWKAYNRMPPATRGPATTAVFAWIKLFVNSAEFKAAYATERAVRRPEGTADTLSIDEEVNKTIASQLATLEQYKAGLATLPESERAKVLAGLNGQEAEIKSAGNIKTIRTLLEIARQQAGSRAATATAEWEARYPADPQMFVKRYLEDFLAATDRIDFTLPTFIVKRIQRRDAWLSEPGIQRTSLAEDPCDSHWERHRARRARVFCSGNLHFVLEPDGTVMGWALGPNGAAGCSLGLGHNDRAEPHSANAVVGLRNAVSIAIGSNASYALLADGRVMAWGANARGTLGNTPLSELERTARPRPLANAPTPVLGISDAVAVATRHDHTLALTRDGRVHAWGWGPDGQLGIGAMPIVNFKSHSPAAMTFVPYPIMVPGLSEVVAIACGPQHSLALLEDGTIRAWGLNRRGQLGDGTTTTRRTPVAVVGIRSAVAIAAHSDNSAAILSDGTAMTWGRGGALGRRPPNPEVVSTTPGPVVGVTGIRELAFADIHALALTTSGAIVSWGFQNVGEVGHGDPNPAPIPGLTNVQSIAATTSRSFAVLPDGTIMTWGVVPLWARVLGDPAVSRSHSL